MIELSGAILVDKPAYITSYDVIRKIKHLLPTKKIGHTGTLDPLASGLMILLLGSATKLASFFLRLNKVYRFTIKLGEETDTMDSTGKIIRRCDYTYVTMEKLKEAIESLKGPMEQYPPVYSAVKYKGKPLYEYARKGESVPLKPRKVNILKLSLDECSLPFVTLTTEVTSGTYVRSLAKSIGDKLGCYAHVSYLRRLSVDGFNVEQAIEIKELAKRLEMGDKLDKILILEDKLLSKIQGIQI